MAKIIDQEVSAGLPYPTTPASPNGPSIALPPQNGSIEASIATIHDDPIGSHNTTDVWADMVRPELTGELPTSLRAGGGRILGDPGVGTTRREDSLPSSLQTGPAVWTPRSSFDSQRSLEPALKPMIPVEIGQPTQSLNPQTLSSNNPWASASTSPPQNLHVSTIIQPSDDILDSPPFAEPWMDFAASPTQPRPLVQDFAPCPFNTEGDNPYDSFENHHKENQGVLGNRNRPFIDGDVLKPVTYQALEPQELDGLSPWSVNEVDKDLPKLPSGNEELRPELHPRDWAQNEDIPPPKPPRVPLPSMTLSVENPVASPKSPYIRLRPETSQTDAIKQRGETYQIRLVNWFDASSGNDPRISPVMVQNANGPCPLLALVNALTLSTPAYLKTPLVETLHSREQVSLELLLDAVIDELMSGRRRDAAHTLPDVGDLYAFLVNLHTGMNVNPSFIPAEEDGNSLLDAPLIESPSNPNHFRKAGGFEDTKEMKLYSTFGVPLIHGWIPPRNHPAFPALKRSARTYEEAQNLMFREEELEDKLRQQGLSPEEQLMLEDVSSVKYFLSSSATQLTAYGLNTMTVASKPGSIAILFRNDHFSTLYKHPHSGQLFTLVTDMGYAGHDEVVWESLADVSGEDCEFFAGDFRPVGNSTKSSSSNIHGTDGSRFPKVSGFTRGINTIIKAKNTRPNRSLLPNDPSSAPSQRFSSLYLGEEPLRSPNMEQEDHDLALALQLQEEEEDIHRRESAARRREEDQLSQTFLSSQAPSSSPSTRRPLSGHDSAHRGQEVRPLVPPRGGSATAQTATPRKVILENSGDEAPPPTYEQAAKGPAYHPPIDHPAHTPSTPAATGNNSTRPQVSGQRQSAYVSNSAAFGGSPSTHGGNASATFAASPPRRGGSRRRGGSAASSSAAGRGSAAQEGGSEKDCVVM